VHQRILRDPEFDQHPLAVRLSKKTGGGPANKITPVSNLLGRTRTRHLLLGLLQVLPTGQLAVSDVSGSIILDMQSARAVPDAEAAWFCPGMILLVEGVYVEEHGGSGSTSEAALGTMGGVGATIGGRFVVSHVAHPPCERRATTLAMKENEDGEQPAEAFGWTDFLGVGSSKATGSRMRKLMTRLLGTQVSLPEAPKRHNSTRIVVASEVNLDKPSTINALRLLFAHYDAQPMGSTPLAIVLIGNFISAPALAGTAGGSSLAYKEAFNSLATIMSDFPTLISRTTWIFVPGDNDAWPSAFAAGGAVPLPRKGVPDMFTGRVRRVVAEANREMKQGKGEGGKGRGKEGEVVWASNPARVTWFGVAGEMVVFRDDVTGRLRRTAVRFPKLQEEDLAGGGDGDEVMTGANAATDDDQLTTSPDAQAQQHLDPDTLSSRRLTKTLLDQAHLSPFPLSIRPLHWDHALSCLNLYPLPTSLIIADAEAPAFAVMYNGCCVMNPGRIVEGRRGEKCAWVEFDVLTKRGEVRMI
jgi:DNA polymerase epsilon subunit 2